MVEQRLASASMPTRGRLRTWATVIGVTLLIGGCGTSSPSASPASNGSTPPASGPTGSGAASPSLATGQCSPGGTLVMARNQEPDTLDPLTGTSNNGTIFAAMQIFQRLVEQGSTSREPVPGIAESWEAAPDGLSYTFHLGNATFSNGDPVTAEDVKFSIEGFANQELNASAGFLAVNIKGAEVVDANTVRMDMKQPDASILAALTLMEASILPKAVIEAQGHEAFGQNPIGSGPFMVKQWNPGQSLELVRNPHYAVEGKPYLDGVTFLLVKDDNARILKAQSGEADVVEAIPMSQAATIQNLAGWSLHNDAILAQDNVWLNHSWTLDGSKPLGDKLVRQALNYATPKEDINQLVFNGLGTISNTGTTITQFWDSTIPPYPYDVAKAKEVLGQSSMPNGFTLPLVIPAGDGAAQQTAEIVQQAWAQIGVTVEIQPLDPAVHSEKIAALDYGAAIFSATIVTSDTPDDSELASIMYDWSTDWLSFFSDYKSEAASDLVHQGVATADPEERRKIYSELQKLTLDDAVSVPLVIPPALTAVRNRVIDFKTILSGWWLLQDVCLNQ